MRSSRALFGQSVEIEDNQIDQNQFHGTEGEGCEISPGVNVCSPTAIKGNDVRSRDPSLAHRALRLVGIEPLQIEAWKPTCRRRNVATHICFESSIEIIKGT